jgi:hypothetical protein
VPTLIALIIVARTPKYRKYLFVAIPVVLFILFKLIYMVDAIKAQPKNTLPADYFFLHSVEIPQKVIFLWIIEKDKDTPYTVMIPWTQKDSKATQDAKKAVSEGKAIAGKRKSKEQSPDDETGDLMLYQFQIKDLYKK